MKENLLNKRSSKDMYVFTIVMGVSLYLMNILIAGLRYWDGKCGSGPISDQSSWQSGDSG
jgi:hypothetical protein